MGEVRFVFVVCLLSLAFSVAILRASASTPNQCAPATPPTPTGPLITLPAQAGALLMNEVLLFSNTTWDCADTNPHNSHYQRWIELYNPGKQALALTPHTYFDNGPGTAQKDYNTVPLGSAIAAHGFLVIFPQNDLVPVNGQLTLRLLVDTQVIDQVTITVTLLGLNQSYERYPDGGSQWQVTNTPTIDRSNVLPPTPSISTHRTKKVSHQTRKKSGATATPSIKGKASNGSTPTDHTGSQSTPSAGVQPTWNTLRSPGNDSSTPQATPAALPATSAIPTAQDKTDTFHKVLLTTLFIVLASILYLFWRRLRKKEK